MHWLSACVRGRKQELRLSSVGKVADEALEATVTARAAEKALRRGKGRPAAARDPSVVLLSKRRPARPWRANPFRKRPPPPMTPAAFNFRP